MAVTTHSFLLRQDGNDYTKLEVYRKHGGYQALEKALKMTPDEVTAEVKKGVIRGRGGAGFPAGVKWGFVPKDTDKPKYLAVNGDEGEPGTFKDNYYLSEDPHRVIEGSIICAYACGLQAVYLYIRGEFAQQMKVCEAAIEEAYAAGILGKSVMGTDLAVDMYVHPGAGAYICGEETAMLESIEGKPGQPRLKPPFPALVGLFGCPTVINNVETLASVPLVIEHGPDWWNDLGVPGDGGSRIVGVSGHVKRPGVYELGVGANLKEIIYDLCGGILDDRELKGVIPGGASCPVLLPDEIDIPMSVDGVWKAGSMLGTCGIIVMAEGTCVVQACLRLLDFYKHESCGQCTPCRTGSGWVANICRSIEEGTAKPGDIDLIIDVASQIGGHTICAFGDAVVGPAISFATKFREDFEAHIKHGGCPHEGTQMPHWWR